MNALTTTHVYLSDVDTGEHLVTCALPTNPDADLVVFVGGHGLAVHGTHDQLHQLAAAITDAVTHDQLHQLAAAITDAVTDTEAD